MSESLSRADQFLIEEYKNAAQLTYHVDTLRDRLTVFFVTIAGLAAAGLSIVLKDDPSTLAKHVVAILFLLVGLLGLVVTLIVARLRAVQLEHFRILSNIRESFYGRDLALWNIAELAPTTVPTPTRRSGSYMWFAGIMLVASFAFGLGSYLLAHEANDWLGDGCALVLALGAGVVWAVLLDGLYIWRASAADPPGFKKPPLRLTPPADGG